MVIEITKETWEKCGTKTLIYHSIEEQINENIADVVLKRITKKLWQKNKKHYRRRKIKKQSIF